MLTYDDLLDIKGMLNFRINLASNKLLGFGQDHDYWLHQLNNAVRLLEKIDFELKSYS
jgi:hypothetical protein